MADEVQRLIKPISRTRCAGFVTSHFCNSNTEEGDGGGQTRDVWRHPHLPNELESRPQNKTNKQKAHTKWNSPGIVERQLQRHSQSRIWKCVGGFHMHLTDMFLKPWEWAQMELCLVWPCFCVPNQRMHNPWEVKSWRSRKHCLGKLLSVYLHRDLMGGGAVQAWFFRRRHCPRL